MLALFERVVLTRDPPDEGRAGDVEVIVEHYPATGEVPEGCELEVFAASGKTLAVVSVQQRSFGERPSATVSDKPER